MRFGARDYDAAAGRWTAKDPVGFGGGDANLYTYPGNNPINYLDNLGLWPIPAPVSHAWYYSMIGEHQRVLSDRADQIAMSFATTAQEIAVGAGVAKLVRGVVGAIGRGSGSG